ncbi:MAG: DUF429 domain-containing protein [Chloroflexota bacterium]|nr:DUF429 domain-containing protein [Chloroflexota bacterium]
MPTFIGLDLAWTGRNESGICWLKGVSPSDLRCTRLDAAVLDTKRIADEIAATQGPVIVAIDAPLLYTPERWAEREVARRFGRYKAAPHQAHAAVAKGYTAGIDLGEALEARGFTCTPVALLSGERDGRTAVEVYPHTIHVRLFELTERLPYKQKRGRSVLFRQEVMQEYQAHLRRLIEREARGLLNHSSVQRALAPDAAASAKGASLKRLEDTLDGLTCALAAWLLRREPKRWEMIGDLNGYIIAPRA